MGKNQHVTPHPKGGWQVKGAGNTRATVRTSTQKEAADIARKIFPMTPKGIIEHFKLRNPIYLQTAAGGHFGRKEFPWEATDKVKALQAAAAK